MPDPRPVRCTMSWEVTGATYDDLVSMARAHLRQFYSGDIGQVFLALEGATPVVANQHGDPSVWRATARASLPELAGDEF
jgi:hypothetical protein